MSNIPINTAKYKNLLKVVNFDSIVHLVAIIVIIVI